ncbi:MAG: sterol desaturase family protein [Flavobacteriales bacterium]|nr:sterol desaturase family protein [Flavobacteriales bacterium]
MTIGIYTVVYELLEPITPWQMVDHWGAFILCFVAVDLAYYWSHRVSHQVNLFWTGHVVHHQSEEYNLSVALRQGAFQKMLMFWVYLPLAAIGFPPEWFLISMGFNLLYQFWIHTELIDRMGPLEYILNTPSHHRVHHGRNPKYIDKNHAGVFIIWDRMFGTFQQEEERPTYGITRPLSTFNPVMAHVQPFKELWADVGSIPSLGDKIRFLFASPGWYPESMGGFKAPPELTGEEQKYDRKIPLGLNIYLLVEYTILIGASAFILFTLENYTMNQKMLFLVFTLYQVFALGSIFDQSRRGVLLEAIRLALMMGFGVWLALVIGQIPVAAAVIISGLVSTAWFAILRSRGRFDEKTD